MKTREVDRTFAANYIRRAEECLESAKRAFADNMWNSCVINAIHCAISAADAYCVLKRGLRSAGTDHRDTIALFLSTNSQSEEIKRSVKHLMSLISIKTDAEYGERLQTQGDAEAAIKHAERLLDFVKGEIETR